LVNLVSIETTTQESTGLALCERQYVADKIGGFTYGLYL